MERKQIEAKSLKICFRSEKNISKHAFFFRVLGTKKQSVMVGFVFGALLSIIAEAELSTNILHLWCICDACVHAPEVQKVGSFLIYTGVI